MSTMLHRQWCTDRDIKEALALHKPCRQIYVPSFQLEKPYAPGVLIYNWAEERRKVVSNSWSSSVALDSFGIKDLSCRLHNISMVFTA